jgi:hypothetical protein
MARLGRIKEEIGWLKLVFGALVAVDASLLGWLAQNYGNANSVLLLVGISATMVLTGAIVWVNGTAYRRIQKLEEL